MVDTVYPLFTESYLGMFEAENKRIRGIDSFLKIFTNFVNGYTKSAGPITISGFVESAFCSSLNSGLVISTSEDDHNADFVKSEKYMLDENFDLVIRMRTDVEFPERVPLEECQGDGLFMMNGAFQAGAGREYCDWFYCGPLNRVKQFDPLVVYDEFYKDGIRHMHDLVRQTLAACQIPHKVLDLKAWMTDRSKVK